MNFLPLSITARQPSGFYSLIYYDNPGWMGKYLLAVNSKFDFMLKLEKKDDYANNFIPWIYSQVNTYFGQTIPAYPVFSPAITNDPSGRLPTETLSILLGRDYPGLPPSFQPLIDSLRAPYWTAANQPRITLSMLAGWDYAFGGWLNRLFIYFHFA